MTIPYNSEGKPIATDEEIENVIKIQNLLTQTNKKNAEEIYKEICTVLDFKTPSHCSFIAREVIQAYLDIVQDQEVLIEVMKKLCSKHVAVKPCMLEVFGTPVSDCSVKVMHFKILRRLLDDGIFQFDDVLDLIGQYPADLNNEYVALITHFAHYIEDRDKGNLLCIINLLHEFTNISPLYAKMLKTLHDAAFAKYVPVARRWTVVDMLCKKGYDSEYAAAFTERDIERIKGVVKNGAANDITITPTAFYPNKHFLASPKFSLLVVYYGLEDVFRECIYNMRKTVDNNNHGLLYYAACGGNIKILEELKSIGHFKLKGQKSKKKKEYFKRRCSYDLVPPISRDLGVLGKYAAGPSEVDPNRMEKKPNEGLLALAASERRFEALKWMVENLEFAYDDYVLALIESVKVNFVAGVKYLLSLGIDVNTRTDDSDMSILHLACECGSIEVVKLLLTTKGIDINIRNDKNQTIVHSAAYGKNEIVFDLVCSLQGIDKDAVDIYGNTPEAIWNDK